MLNHLTETMLKSYYIAEDTVGRFCEDKKPLFAAYAGIFLIPQEETERLYSLTRREEVLGIESEREYHRYLRVKQFKALNSNACETEPEIDEIIDLKGNAFTTASNYQLMLDAKETRAVACENLTFAADSGLVYALTAFGILQMEGIIFGKDPQNGLKKILRAARWNDEEALFAALYYDAGNREKYLGQLHGCLVRIGHADVFERVKAVYGTYAEGKHGEYRLLEKAFGQGIVKRDVYNESYARLAYSNLLSERDKEALILTPNKELFAEACTLPLRLLSVPAPLNLGALNGIRPDHPEERDKIMRALGNTDLGTISAYRPLCLVSESKYLLRFYADLISRCFRGAHVERIEVGGLSKYDLDPTPNNVFVRSCDETFNVYLLFFCGEIENESFDAAKNFLQSDKRGKFRLNHPRVALNLSAILPVCFCDRENAKKLGPYCDMVRIAELSAEEKASFITEIVREKGNIYGVKKLTQQDGLAEKLLSYGIDEVDRAVDAAVREHRANELVLTEAMILPYFKGIGEKPHKYGFGGNIHEDY